MSVGDDDRVEDYIDCISPKYSVHLKRSLASNKTTGLKVNFINSYSVITGQRDSLYQATMLTAGDCRTASTMSSINKP